MKKASLVGILFEDSTQSSRKAGGTGSGPKGCKDVFDLLCSTSRAPQKSSKMIKITQFNSEMIMQDDKVMQKDYSINGSNCLQRNFHIKRLGELKNKAAANAQKAIEIEVKRREKSIKSRMNLSQYCEQSRISPSIDKILVTTRCNFRS